LAERYDKGQRVYVTRLTADPKKLATVVATQVKHRREGATGTVIHRLANTCLVRHDFDHAEAVYAVDELAELPARPADRERDETSSMRLAPA
jgi:hypothetical protein